MAPGKRILALAMSGAIALACSDEMDDEIDECGCVEASDEETGDEPCGSLGTSGMENGDRLQQLEGFDMSTPEAALQAYARLRAATSCTVRVTRRGDPITIEYKIQ